MRDSLSGFPVEIAGDLSTLSALSAQVARLRGAVVWRLKESALLTDQNQLRKRAHPDNAKCVRTHAFPVMCRVHAPCPVMRRVHAPCPCSSLHVSWPAATPACLQISKDLYS